MKKFLVFGLLAVLLLMLAQTAAAGGPGLWLTVPGNSSPLTNEFVTYVPGQTWTYNVMWGGAEGCTWGGDWNGKGSVGVYRPTTWSFSTIGTHELVINCPNYVGVMVDITVRDLTTTQQSTQSNWWDNFSIPYISVWNLSPMHKDTSCALFRGLGRVGETVPPDCQ